MAAQEQLRKAAPPSTELPQEHQQAASIAVSRMVKILTLLVLLLGAGTILASVYGAEQRSTSQQESECQMTYMRPSYHHMRDVLQAQPRAAIKPRTREQDVGDVALESPLLGSQELEQLRGYNLFLYRVRKRAGMRLVCCPSQAKTMLRQYRVMHGHVDISYEL